MLTAGGKLGKCCDAVYLKTLWFYLGMDTD